MGEKKYFNFFKEISGYLLIIIAVIVIRLFIFDPIRVDGPSMNNTLCNGEIIVINKFNYRKNDVKRYDIVVVKSNGKKIIKRVIGLPNEKIEIKDNKVYANGEELDNSFTSTESDDFTLAKIGLTKIPGDSYFVLGDNRKISLDSRYNEVGTIKKEDIVGKAEFIIFPFDKMGSVYKKNNKKCGN